MLKMDSSRVTKLLPSAISVILNYFTVKVEFVKHVIVWCFFLQATIFKANSQSAPNFSSSSLAGENLNSPTSLDFGPDNRLYVSQQNGIIIAFTINKNGPGSYSVTASESIQIIRTIPNHNDDGTINPAVVSRQITGILVVGTSANPIIYVSSSDSRIGGGGTAGDQNLDTNSGIISRITWNGLAWVKVDIIKGLPRSEENHSNNGLVLDQATNTLYIAMGGHTNAGAPSNNFAFITEYALSAAILKVDLSAIETQFDGSYTLPTLDDPSRPNTGPNGSDQNDPWGGNDGLNQAKLVPGGPVQIYSAGYRNAYDLVLTQTPGKEGRMYTIDNGPNVGWGGYPDKEGTAQVTNNYVIGEPGSTRAGVNDAVVNNLDNLHLVSAPGLAPIYGGHPNPIRANPTGAGLYRYDNATAVGTFLLSPTIDWPPVPESMANPVEADYRNPGVNDVALYTWKSSTNGMDEYSSSAFNGAMMGDILAASFDGNIYRLKMNAEGTAVQTTSVLAGGFGSQPLDLIAQGDDEIFPGTVWAVTYGARNITVFEPSLPEGIWREEIYSTTEISPTGRHENGFVEANGNFYLMGGRNVRSVEIYNPVTKVWSLGGSSPIELHHFQPVEYKGEIYAICAMKGGYPNEIPLNEIYKYNTTTNTWAVGPTIPPHRKRGSAGVVVYDNKFYIIGGIQNGHIDGWVNWVDEFDPATGVWTELPNAPNARDHFMATVIDGKIYAASGRQTHYPDFAANTISDVDVYDILAKVWNTPTQLPTARAAAGISYIGGELVVAGGETITSSTALRVVEAYNPLFNTWSTKPPLNLGRHGTQMISYRGKLYLCAGAYSQGGNGQNNTMAGADFVANCSGNDTSFILDDDGDGYSNADEAANATDPCSAASKPNDSDLDGISNLTDTDDDNDGLTDKTDVFALDIKNGITTESPIDYPFLNGSPGFGLFGLGFTGLMSNKLSDYQDLFDSSDPKLIMGGAVGIASTPAEPGDALTNNQKNAFQFGVNINKSSLPFVINSKILGSTFFDGATGTELGTQSQGVYFGTGDQDNYYKIALHANNGVPGIQILVEDNGVVIYQNIFPISNILAESSIDFYITINPATGGVQCEYQPNSGSIPVKIGPELIMNGNLLRVLQDNNALAIGLIASSGNKEPFSAAWDYINLKPAKVAELLEVVRINSGGTGFQFEKELWVADRYFTGGRTYGTTKSINNTTNDILYQSERFGNFSYNIPVPESGLYTVDMHFAEIYMTTPGTRVFNIDVENDQRKYSNIDLFKDYGGALAASTIKAGNIQVNDGFMSLTLSGVVNHAKISGISLYKQYFKTNQTPFITKPSDVNLYNGQSWAYQIVASDPDSNAVLLYSAINLPDGLVIDSKTGVISGIVTGNAGSYTVNLTINDEFNVTATTTLSIVISPAEALREIIRINAGGPTLTFGNETWKSDQNFSGGKIYVSTLPISNTTNDALYRSERYGNMTYSIPVPEAGLYTVEFHASETYFNAAGKRIFSIDVETGQYRLQDIDLYRDYGGLANAVVFKGENIGVLDGFLTISLTSVVNNAKISGIVVLKQPNQTSNNPPISSAGLDKTMHLPQSSAQLNGSGYDPENGTNITYSWSQVGGPSQAIFDNTSIANPTVNELVAGTYILQLVVKDQELLASVPDKVIITVYPASILPQITSLTLVNASNEQDIRTIVQNDVLNLATLASNSLNIRANGNSSVASVRFALTGAQTRTNTESGVPYALFGDTQGNYASWTPAIGNYTLTATPYPSAGVAAGLVSTINFSVTNTSSPPTALYHKKIDSVNLAPNTISANKTSISIDGNFMKGASELSIVYPNPAQKEIFLRIYVIKDSQYQFYLYNTLGQKIKLPSTRLHKGVNTVFFDLHPLNLVPGLYSLIVTNDLSEKNVFKIVIQ